MLVSIGSLLLCQLLRAKPDVEYYSERSAQNMLRDLGRIVWVTATSATGVGLLVNAAIVLL